MHYGLHRCITRKVFLHQRTLPVRKYSEYSEQSYCHRPNTKNFDKRSTNIRTNKSFTFMYSYYLWFPTFRVVFKNIRGLAGLPLARNI